LSITVKIRKHVQLPALGTWQEAVSEHINHATLLGSDGA
jgi:hypothetical protein